VIDVYFSFHVPIDDLRHVGATPGASERRPLPYPAGHELERPRADFLSGSCHADDHRHSPAAMAALQRLAHDVDVADAFEAVVRAAAGEVDQRCHKLAADCSRIDEVRHPELAAKRFARGIKVDTDDHARPGHARSLHHVQSDAAQAKDDDIGARLDLGGIDDRADAGGDTAADIANLVERRIATDLG